VLTNGSILFLSLLAVAAVWSQPHGASYASLAAGQIVSGFKTVAVYLDDSDRPMGARFQHERSGFTMDLLQIQSVPQAFIWVTTYPTSNMGEPHTQEHLLLGKGNQGRALASEEGMSLVASSAFTQQWMTCYDFYSPAGPEVFYQHLDRTLDALLHPDYTDEEVHREVRNFGVSVNPQDGQLHLEEKGSVYAEMVTSMDQAISRLYRAALVAVYGPEHPLSFSSGGLPAALRVIQPSDIRRFHASHYFLANMGMIAALPKEMALGPALARLDASLRRAEPQKPMLPVMTEGQLPAPRPSPGSSIEYVAYPFRNDRQPGSVMMLWPADRQVNAMEQILAGLFLSNVAGGPDTNLYKRLIDSKTREADFGARGVNAFMDTDQGHPVLVMFQDLPVAHMNDEDLGTLRAKVMDEFARIAAYADGSAELAQFNERLKGRILEQRRVLSKFVNSPPGFGLRGTGGAWVGHVYELNKEPGFRKSLTEKAELAEIEKLIAGSRNIWRDYLPRWKITGVTPHVEAAKPDPKLAGQEAKEREDRAAAEVARLKEKFGAATDQQAMERYSAEYDAATAAIEKAAKTVTPSKFIDKPPMTLDDQLDYRQTRLAGGVPLVSSTFDSLTSGTTGVALRLDAVPEDRLVYVSLLPALLTLVGVIENGKPVSYEQMTQRMRNEILSLNASFSTNAATDRYELVVRGAGNDPVEARRALEWMRLVLWHPDWRPENLGRIRDLVDQSLAQLRNTTQTPEENWVSDPAVAYRRQDNPLLLATASFMTRTHNVYRLRWMLKEGGSEAVYGFLAALGDVGGSRAERQALLAAVRAGKYAAMEKLAPPEKALAVEAAKDLDATLSDIPDSSLAADWKYLCAQMARDLHAGPEGTLQALDEVRSLILNAGGARMFAIASTGTQKELGAGIQELAGRLDTAPVKKAVYGGRRRIDGRLAAREDSQTDSGAHPVFVGLLNANSQGGVFLNSAPVASYHDTSRDKVLDYLATNLYAGGGAHSVFMKTWGAGLAYSNGIRVRPADGRLNYYAERTPELQQTLKFVIDEMKKAAPDQSLTEYAVAGAFDGTRSSLAYETRGEAMANDLADGLTSEVVTRFHQAVLDLRKAPNLAEELFQRMNGLYARVLPGMGVKAKDVAGGTYFAIGPEKQLAAYEEYLKHSEGAEARVHRLYPRDFWLE
jgi:Zn-dependent M16 (insulinase) family peptidase